MASAVANSLKAPKKEMKAMHWVFTAQGELSDALDLSMTVSVSTHLKAEMASRWMTMQDRAMRPRYMVYQLEIAPTTGKMHAQGYIEFRKQHRLSAMKKVAGKWHWEPRMGSRKEARAYSMKDDTRAAGHLPAEFGVWIAGKGARSDTDEFAAAIVEDGLDTAVEEHPGMFLRYAKGAHMLAERQVKTKAMRDMHVQVLWGDTGTGKTYQAVEWAEASGLSWWMGSEGSNGAWYAYGYEGQEVVIFDDYRSRWMSFSRLLTLLHEYRTHVNVCGRGTQWRACWIILTSNYPPDQWYDPERCHYPALKRRLHYVTNVHERSQKTILFGGLRPTDGSPRSLASSTGVDPREANAPTTQVVGIGAALSIWRAEHPQEHLDKWMQADETRDPDETK